MFKFFFHLFTIFLTVIHASSHDCQYSWCSDNNILIRFPFQLEGDHQHPYCGYPNPGFKLTCSTNNSKTVLKLPYTTGEFYVRKINYLRQQIHVYDPHYCLPNRLLSLNLSGSPFIAKSLRNYTLLSCSTQNIGSQFVPVHCLSNSTHFVSAIPSVNLTNSLPQSCHVFRNLSVPVAIRQQMTYVEDIASYLQLAWHSPDCRYCELQAGMCGFDSTSRDRVRCFSDHQTGGDSKSGLGVSRIVLLSTAGAATTCAIGIAFFTWFQRRRRTIISPEPAATTTMSMRWMGLDESTIESFEKVVLGESLRLPAAANDGCCSICLSEYNSMDIIRCIPECKHCFHAYCIDEWLRMNATCPLCRNSPSPSHSLPSD